MGNSDLSFSAARGWAAGRDLTTAAAVTTPTTATATVTLTRDDVQALTLHGATPVIAAPTPQLGDELVVYLIQDGTGSRIPTYTGIRWAAATAPTLSTAAASVDIIKLSCYDGTHYEGTLVGKAFA